MKNFINKYKHAWTLLYALIYFPWFSYLEKTVTTNFNLIYLPVDDKIPFVDIFIIPYLLWFLFVAGTIFYLLIYSKEEYYKACAFLFSGMTIFLIISTIYPNGLNLRESITYNDSIFSDMVKMLQSTDTSTNVFPSIHVYNSIGCFIALAKSKGLEQHKWIKVASGILATLIILSTMFLKQHSVLDVIGAFVMAAVFYVIVYVPKRSKVNDSLVEAEQSLE
ncbi:MAG: phosphatase PAP2 family protein [Lachnospiraceae bacterium]|nr:phosphatase PAP2 family protein [Lachnospiraceae bacterium]